MNIGIIGGGAIAQFLLASDASVNSLLIRNQKKYSYLKKEHGVDLYTNVDDFLASNIDIVVEAANIDAVKEYLPIVIEQKDAIIISIGAFADETFLNDVRKKAINHHRKIHLPSGAIGGLDLLQNAHVLKDVKRVTITTTKPADSLTKEILTDKKIVYSGTAKEAIRQFPKNVNVSIILSLAGIGTDQTTIQVIADPDATKNEHMIDIEGAFGTSTLTVVNEPMEENPNTSLLAALSVLGTIKKLANPIQIG